MNRLKILNLWKSNKSLNSPLLGTNEILEGLDFMADYLLNFKRFDRNFALTRGFFIPLWNLDYEDTEQEVLDTWKEDVDNFLLKHKDDYNRLWSALQVEYNPLDNFDRHEEYTDKNSGDDKTKKEYGQRKTTAINGARKSTDEIGEQNNSDDWGKKESEQETTRAGFDSAGYVADNKVTYSEDRNLDDHKIGKRTDVHNTDAVTDTNTADAVTDNETLTHGLTVKHEGHLYGNIGVTTSQQMLQSEIDLRERFNFYEMLFSAIIRELCTYEDTDAWEPFQVDRCNKIFEEVKKESEGGSVEAYVTQLSNGVRITMTDDVHGTTTADVLNGTDGKNGLTPTFEINNEGHLIQGYEED